MPNATELALDALALARLADDDVDVTEADDVLLLDDLLLEDLLLNDVLDFECPDSESSSSSNLIERAINTWRIQPRSA